MGWNTVVLRTDHASSKQTRLFLEEGDVFEHVFLELRGVVLEVDGEEAGYSA
jgi:hypothetical protein